ncbi:DcrB-related protein [Rubrivirga sp.]|uniref:DcrB-related protein n=1 Tax=Rubrivirga sp. TaxID=1885344 RepID=UPI003B5285F4
MRDRLGHGSRLGASRPAPTARRAPAPPPTTPYRADAFSLALPPGWSDATTHTIAGPVADGRAHHVTVVTVPHDGQSLAALADAQVRAALDALPGAAVLVRDAVALDDGSPAERAVLRWSPVAGDVLYQQQVVAVVGDRALTLSASFSARTRRLLGPEVHRLMLSLAAPAAGADRSAPGRPVPIRRLGR